MSTNVHGLQTLDELRTYVHETLCEYDHLEVGAFDFSEQILVRGGKPCGLLFRLHGPRSVQLLAIWETDRNTLLFYNSSGERFQKTELVAMPKLRLQAA
jgi:hypothetical protein